MAIPPRPEMGSLTGQTATVTLQGLQKAVLQLELETAQPRPHDERSDPQQIGIFPGDGAENDHLRSLALRCAKAPKHRAPNAAQLVEENRSQGDGIRNRLARCALVSGVE